MIPLATPSPKSNCRPPFGQGATEGGQSERQSEGQSKRLPKIENRCWLSTGSPPDVWKGVRFWLLGCDRASAPGPREFTWLASREYTRPLVYYLYTLRVCSGPQRIRFLSLITAAHRNLTAQKQGVKIGLAGRSRLGVSH